MHGSAQLGQATDAGSEQGLPHQQACTLVWPFTRNTTCIRGRGRKTRVRSRLLRCDVVAEAAVVL